MEIVTYKIEHPNLEPIILEIKNNIEQFYSHAHGDRKRRVCTSRIKRRFGFLGYRTCVDIAYDLNRDKRAK